MRTARRAIQGATGFCFGAVIAASLTSAAPASATNYRIINSLICQEQTTTGCSNGSAFIQNGVIQNDGASNTCLMALCPYVYDQGFPISSTTAIYVDVYNFASGNTSMTEACVFNNTGSASSTVCSPWAVNNGQAGHYGLSPSVTPWQQHNGWYGFVITEIAGQSELNGISVY